MPTILESVKVELDEDEIRQFSTPLNTSRLTCTPSNAMRASVENF